MFDIKGNRRKWWSNETLVNFERKSVCLVDQYSNFTFYGRQVNYYFCHLKQIHELIYKIQMAHSLDSSLTFA